MNQIRISTAIAVGTSVLLIAFGTVLFHELEPWSWAESFYFTVATLTTVGYGDIHPTTDGTRIAAAFFILIGVGIVIAALGRIGSNYLSAQERRITTNVTKRLQKKRTRS